MEPWIKFGRNQIHQNEIVSELAQHRCKDFEKSALIFCHDWLNGKDSFTLQTSGSTGTPKQITATRNQLKASARITTEALGLKKNGTSLICLDTRYIGGIMMIVRSLEVGMNIILVEPSSNPLEEIDENTSIDFTALVPLQLETILKSPQKDKLNQISVALIGGAALNRKTVHDIQSFSCNFYATYGMTETLSHIALQKLNGVKAQDYFQILSGIAISKDERECLTIHAPHLSNEDIVTNDLVDLITPKQFRWLGRIDHVINTGGVKVIPEKVEESIGVIFNELKIPNRSFIAALPDPLLGQSVTLFIEGESFPQEIEELLKGKINQLVSRFERPKSIQYVLNFVNTDTGKINKLKTIASVLL